MGRSWNDCVVQWDATLDSILARFDGVLAEATTVSEPLLAGITTDASAVERLWQPVEAKMHQMTEEVSDAWDSISDAMSEAPDAPETGLWLEGVKRDATTTEIEVRHGRARAAVLSRAALQMQRHATTSDDPTALQMFAYGGAVYLAQQKAIEHWAAMKVSANRIRSYRYKKAVPMQLLEYYARVSTDYYRVRHGTEAEYNQSQQASLEQKIANFTKDAHKLLRQHPQWRAAQSTS